MDYKEKYEAALERAKKIYKSAPDINLELENIFPELAESEDERIRKFIAETVFRYYGDSQEYLDVLAYLEKQKEQKPVPDKFSGLKSLMLQYLQSAANRKDDAEIESDTDLFGRKILDYVWKQDEKQKEQKSIECLKPEKDCWYVCVKDFYGGGKKQSSKGDLVQAKGGMYMMGRDDISEWFRKAYYDEIKPAEWSEEDERMRNNTILSLQSLIDEAINDGFIKGVKNEIAWLKSLRPSWKP